MTAERPEVVDARKRRTEAYVSLMRAADGCPTSGSRAHDEYQRTVMQPLREALAASQTALAELRGPSRLLPQLPDLIGEQADRLDDVERGRLVLSPEDVGADVGLAGGQQFADVVKTVRVRHERTVVGGAA